MPAHSRGAARRPHRRIVAGATCLLLSLAALTAFTSSARAADTTTSVASTADTTVNSSTPTKATAASNSIGVYGSNPQAIGLLRFVVPAAPAGKTLTGATLKLRTSTIASAGSANVQNIRSAGDSWTEAAATWNNRPALGTATLGTVPANSQANTSYSVPLDLAAWGTPSGSVSLAIQGTGTDSFWIWTREYATAAYRPTLQLTWSDAGPPSDTTAPTAPSAPTASVDGSTVDLAWTASTDAVGVTGYTVHRSATAGFTPSPSTVIGTTTSATTYADLDRPVGTWYYRVTARDAAGNTSVPSGTGAATVTNPPPSDTTDPTAPTALHASATGATINLTWTAATDDTAVTGYTVYRSATGGFTPSAANRIGTSTTPEYSDAGRPAGTWYYRVTAHDAAANESDASEQISAVAADPPPTTVTSTTDTADGYVNASAPTSTLSTSSSLSVYGTNPQMISYARFVIPTPDPGRTLTGVTLRLRTSTVASAGTAAPITVRPAGDTWTESGLTWNNRPAITGPVIGTLPGGSAADTGYSVPLDLTAWGNHTGSVTVALQNAATTTPASSDSLWLWSRRHPTPTYRPTLQLTWSDAGPPSDTTAPTAPSAPTASVDGSTVNLAWTASTDAVGVTGYTVHRSATAGFTPSASTVIGTTTSATTYADLDRPAGTWHYRVTARDAAGNTSDPSSTASATVSPPPPDTTKPTAPTALHASASGSTINLSWTAATDDTAVTIYSVYRSATADFASGGEAPIDSTTTTTYADTARPVGTWYYRVTAGDAAGNSSDPSNVDSATVAEPPPPDTTKPTAPTELGTTVTGSTVAVSWDNATDDTAVTGYTVYRSATDGFTPSAANRIGTSTTPEYSDAGRPAGTWYYRVTAHDAAANESDASEQISAVVADPPPTTVTSTTDTADGYVNASAPTSTLSTSSSLSIYGTNPQMISYARFVIPTPDPGQTLTGITLRLRTSTVASGGTAAPITVRPAGDTWTESGLTWNNRPAITGPVIGTLPGGSAADTAYTVPLDLTSWGNPTGQVTVALQNAAPSTPASSDSMWLWSRRHPTPTYRPTLLLTWSGSGSSGIPEPPTTNLDPITPGATSVVTALGDIVCPPGDAVTPKTCKHAEVRSLIDSINPDKLIMTGDLAQGLASYSEYTAPGKFKDTFDDIKDKILPVLGNHEAYTPQAAGYWDYWYGPGTNNGRIGVRPYGWYTAAIGSWRFIGLDSECDTGGLAGGCDVTSPQYQWLKAVLDNDTSQCTVVAYHKPRWTTGAGHPPDLSLAPIWDLLASHHVDVVLNGHNHGAESFKPIGVSGTALQPVLQDDGTREFVDGIGGDSQYTFTSNGSTPMNAVIARSTGTFGVLKLTLKPGGYDWGYLPIAGSTFSNVAPASGSFSGSDTCH